MTQAEWEAFVESLENVQREDNYGFLFYFVGDDHRLPFMTIGYSDNEYDNLSQLNREGVFRINLGVSKTSYQALFEDSETENIDYAALNVLMPHHEYAKQHYLCILNPSGKNEEITKDLIEEAHAIAAERWSKIKPKS